jgi:hypothetical protein
MKVIWEEKDIVAGRVLQKPDVGITGTTMIGYRYNKDMTGQSATPTYGLISLADGLWIDVGSGIKEALVTHLNNVGHYMPIELLDNTSSRLCVIPRMGRYEG